MKIVVAPDSFKGSLSAARAAEIMAAQFRFVFPGADIVSLPMADGGEGTLEAVAAHVGARIVEKEIQGPLGERVMARYGLVDKQRTAIIESAQACGLGLIPPDRQNPLRASSAGLGELIRDALDRGIRKIVVTLGGSATVDGGLGMARALGFGLLDADQRAVPDGGEGLLTLAHIDRAKADSRLRDCIIQAAADVSAPLCGPLGAAMTYGPQKGASPEMTIALDRGLMNLKRIVLENGMLTKDRPGDGAAGGLGIGLRAFCGAEIQSGAQWVCQAVGLENHLKQASLLITGEGRSDAQTLQGKLCQKVAELARKHKLPVMLLSGSIADHDGLSEMADFLFSISCGEETVAQQMHHAATNLARTALSCARLIRLRL